MNISDVKLNLNEIVTYEGSSYILCGVILRKHKTENKFYYQAELADFNNRNSLLICDLLKVKKEVIK